MESEAFTVFYHQMVPSLVRFIGRRLTPELAEDVAHDTMITLWRKNPPAPLDDHDLRRLRAFAYLIAAGHMRNAERKIAGERGMLAVICNDGLLESPRADPTAEAVLPGRLDALLPHLRPDDRRALVLLSAGFKTAEIAELLHVSPKAASMRLRRARDRLRQLWEAQASGGREGGGGRLPARLQGGISPSESADEGGDHDGHDSHPEGKADRPALRPRVADGDDVAQ